MPMTNAKMTIVARGEAFSLAPFAREADAVVRAAAANEVEELERRREEGTLADMRDLQVAKEVCDRGAQPAKDKYWVDGEGQAAALMSFYLHRGVGHLNLLYVVKEHRRKRLALEGCKALARYAKRVGCIKVEVCPRGEHMDDLLTKLTEDEHRVEGIHWVIAL